MPISVLMVGGFLGAGKTTTIARLARELISEGRRVGIVTNDQAEDLVDTAFLRSQGFGVGEVAGACFCCKFNDLTDVLDQLAASETPDVILTEPVGSCTDLVATVLEPLAALAGDRFAPAPLAVLLKPEHGRKILGGKQVGFSPKAAYIFRKQLEEATLVVVNKADTLSPPERDELEQLLRTEYPEKRVLTMSARTGEGWSEFRQALASVGGRRAAPIEVDYGVYAEGEAELGWLNAVLRFSSSPWQLDDLAVGAVRSFAERLRAASLEPVHVKVLAEAKGENGTVESMANLVASDASVELSLASHASSPSARLIVNARVAGPPEVLESILHATAAELAARGGGRVTCERLDRFRPSPPVPTHRYGTSER